MGCCGSRQASAALPPGKRPDWLSRHSGASRRPLRGFFQSLRWFVVDIPIHEHVRVSVFWTVAPTGAVPKVRRNSLPPSWGVSHKVHGVTYRSISLRSYFRKTLKSPINAIWLITSFFLFVSGMCFSATESCRMFSVRYVHTASSLVHTFQVTLEIPKWCGHSLSFPFALPTVR